MTLNHKNTGYSYFDKYGTVYHVVFPKTMVKGDGVCEIMVNRKTVKVFTNVRSTGAGMAKRYLEKALRELSLWK